ncbi:hypothetical protein M758_3G083000 [Ceratodon purpureus]|uniref:Uncharacterized protein n=1 Tax=Ceratodon purpureus TaxID=3225 RepID=A0A8T0IIA0_CERPU|nr:hypothetical protein KC19_3G081700 [Ceratodon purpureus]KAG0622238.1 hypothetical protein M758_3G083000 [Ceratodon purpureus]
MDRILQTQRGHTALANVSCRLIRQLFPKLSRVRCLYVQGQVTTRQQHDDSDGAEFPHQSHQWSEVVFDLETSRVWEGA